jgi:hypothetical protein
MRVYLDLCCLKRQFDVQDQPIVRLQTEAVLSIQALPPGTIDLVRSEAQCLENSLNPVQSRREAVDLWLSQGSVVQLPEAEVQLRIQELQALGFKNFDSFHVASAELTRARAFVTVDHRLLRAGTRHAAALKTRVIDPIQLVEELSQWKP